MKLEELKPKVENVKGYDVLKLIMQGNMLRRPDWKENVYIRICNEVGFDEKGFAVFHDKNTSAYTHSTEGCFMHLGYSSEPIKNIGDRNQDGLRMFFKDDWQDYGFISNENFEKLEKEYNSTKSTYSKT